MSCSVGDCDPHLFEFVCRIDECARVVEPDDGAKVSRELERRPADRATDVEGTEVRRAEGAETRHRLHKPRAHLRTQLGEGRGVGHLLALQRWEIQQLVLAPEVHEQILVDQLLGLVQVRRRVGSLSDVGRRLRLCVRSRIRTLRPTTRGGRARIFKV